MSRVIVFGGAGALGSAIVENLNRNGVTTIVCGRTESANVDIATADSDWPSQIDQPVDGIVWAQGVNASGTVISSSTEDLMWAFEANVVFLQKSLQLLVEGGKIRFPARAVVISSIWQDHARSNKFAYMTSKAAVEGFVKSAAIDLGALGLSMNAVLPGVIDSPMTRANLSEEQINRIERDSLGGKLAQPEDVAETVRWLLSPLSKGVNGQFITVDSGWTINRHV